MMDLISAPWFLKTGGMTRMKGKLEEKEVRWGVTNRQVGRNVTKFFTLIKLGFEMLNVALVFVHKTKRN